MRCDRRGFLLLSSLALAGCGGDAKKQPSGSAGATASPRSVASTSAPTTSAAPVVPSREEMIAKFGASTPGQWGLDVTGVVQRTESAQVALTLDACGGPSGSGIDQQLLDFLIASGTPATLFLNSRWIEANPDLTTQLIANKLFCIGNHGTKHVPLSATGRAAYGIAGTGSVGEAYDEIMGNQQALTALTGTPPRFFRPGTAYYDEVCAQLVRELRMLPVNFDVNTDAGATFSTAHVIQETSKAKPGSICIGHFNQPYGSTYEGLSQVIPQLKASGLTFARLDEMALV